MEDLPNTEQEGALLGLPETQTELDVSILSFIVSFFKKMLPPLKDLVLCRGCVCKCTILRKYDIQTRSNNMWIMRKKSYIIMAVNCPFTASIVNFLVSFCKK